MGADKVIHVILQIVHQHLLGIIGIHCTPGNEINLNGSGHLEQDLQYRDKHHKGEDIEHRRQQSEHHRQDKIPPVGRNKPSQDLKKLLHIPKPFVYCIKIPGKGTLFLLLIYHQSDI